MPISGPGKLISGCNEPTQGWGADWWSAAPKREAPHARWNLGGDRCNRPVGHREPSHCGDEPARPAQANSAPRSESARRTDESTRSDDGQWHAHEGTIALTRIGAPIARGRIDANGAVAARFRWPWRTHC